MSRINHQISCRFTNLEAAINAMGYSTDQIRFLAGGKTSADRMLFYFGPHKLPVMFLDALEHSDFTISEKEFTIDEVTRCIIRPIQRRMAKEWREYERAEQAWTSSQY